MFDSWASTFGEVVTSIELAPEGTGYRAKSRFARFYNCLLYTSTLKTDAAGHAESRLYEIATFKNGKYDTAIKYYLVETKTLDGYTLDQTKHEVTFAYADDSTPVVEVTFNLTNEKPEVPETPNTPDTPQSHEETKVSNAPKTGDSTNIWLPILLLVISTGGMAGLYIIRKRKSK